MSVLIITPEDRDRIKAMVEHARANVIPWDTVRAGALPATVTELKLADRKPGLERPPSDNIVFAGGVRAAFSFEEQPAGVLRHLSVSVPTPGKLPNPIVVQTIAKLFGFSKFPSDKGRIWIEEFEPGHSAINVIEIAIEREMQGGVQ